MSTEATTLVAAPPSLPSTARHRALDRYRSVRSWTEKLTEPLAVEDQVPQAMPDASPTRWHRAHTSWFFETFLLLPHLEGYASPNPAYGHLFNSYYNSLGDPFYRPDRGLITRPTVADVTAYRQRVDEGMEELLHQASKDSLTALLPLLEIGLQHEQQHQELILTDLKNLFARNPLQPAYRPETTAPADATAPALHWHDFEGGLVEIGHDGEGFAFDNEGPRHRVYLEPFRIASRPVTQGEYLDFINDDGYRRPEFWLSDGWTVAQQEGWQAPLYQRLDEGIWTLYTLAGRREVRAHEPVCHLSFYEADAYARWAGSRLPSEAEWEVAADQLLGPGARGEVDTTATFAEEQVFHPSPAHPSGRGQFLGEIWEWTRSAYSPYPGYSPPEGALGEYNAKFMSGQMVLRGGSCVTPRSHIRSTYRNFFHPDKRWQFSGLRLAKDVQ